MPRLESCSHAHLRYLYFVQNNVPPSVGARLYYTHVLVVICFDVALSIDITEILPATAVYQSHVDGNRWIPYAVGNNFLKRLS